MKHEHMILFRLAQVWALCKLAVALVFSLFYKHKRIWLIAERGDDARDNGYCFFMYMKEKHPSEEIYYIISKDSVDRIRLTQYEESIIDYRSMHHYIMLWRASYLVSTHLEGYFPFKGLGVWVKSVFPYYRHKKHINIKHGISINYTHVLDYAYAKWDLIIAGVTPECKYFIQKYGYPPSHVALTGHARYDRLNDNRPKRQLLLMPTWREWIYKDKGFEQTEYAQRYAHLLESQKLKKILIENDINLIFYPHHEIQRYISYFKKINLESHIIVADKEHYDVQQLLKDSALLITDYSSVIFDFAYMRKPIICYQFDYDRYRSEHYQEGWFNYHHSFVDVYTDEEKLIDSIVQYVKNEFALKPEHINYIESIFPFHDDKNCERIYNAIIGLTVK